MISHRLRALVAGVPIVLMSILMVAAPALAADALRITTPEAGSSVSGELVIEGEVTGSRAIDVEFELAPQVLGDCGAPAVTSAAPDVVGPFRASLSTDGLADGNYCLIAVADNGRLSTVIADITVNNVITPGEDVDGLQLSTEALGGSGAASPGTPLTVSVLLGDASTVGTAVLALAVALAAVALAAGLWVRQRTAE